MLPLKDRQLLQQLIKKEVVPAVGCTEPVAVSLAVAKATEMLDEDPVKIEVGLSGNILKNAMGVGIPGTGMIGLPIAIALGAIKKDSSKQLEILKTVSKEDVEKGKALIQEGKIKIYHINDCPSILYIKVKVIGQNGNTAGVVISKEHNKFTELSLNGNIIYRDTVTNVNLNEREQSTTDNLTLIKVWDYATESPIEELKFILEAYELNKQAAQYSLENNGRGHKVGQTIYKHKKHFGDTVLTDMLIMTSGACDARMAGESIPIMSNSGSGNQGIAITLPVSTYAEENNLGEEKTIRALIMAHLTSIYIKQSLGRLSALCGCVVASTGASMALAYLMGGDFQQGSYAVKNMIATLTGMICDGAKPACSLKIASGVGTAYISALMAIDNHCVTSNEGIIDESVDDTIQNFSRIGREAMVETDKVVLEIMSASSK